MNMPKLPTETKPFLWGAAAGAIALAIVGFNWGGWVTGGTSEKLAGTRADEATVAALTPICVAQFRRSAKAPAKIGRASCRERVESTVVEVAIKEKNESIQVQIEEKRNTNE